ncbi:MAG: hypothetical protein QF364_07375 [Candidatus Poseidoniaceae archaeon]|nr:hypothetical protein [Candidatus Poseidoniaceae archaeon]
MARRVQTASLMLLLLCTSALAGCTTGSVDSTESNSTTVEQTLLPQWEIGDQWLYTFITPQFGEDSARLVVAEIDEDEGVYQLGISSEREAQRHAVINHNPFLGRMTIDGLSVYENGEPQSVFSFPWTVGDSWTFTLFGQDWTASTDSLNNGNARVSATSADGHEITYTFSGDKGFMENFVWRNDEGVRQLRMDLNAARDGYSGDVFFYRAGDLLDNRYENNDQEVYDTFLDEGHSTEGDWNTLVWYLDVEISQGGSGSLSMKDHAGASPLTRAWGSSATEKGAIGTIPSNTGEYSLTVTARGQESFIHLKVAGALVFQWTL